jgi:hypothetical protein
MYTCFTSNFKLVHLNYNSTELQYVLLYNPFVIKYSSDYHCDLH